jgi:hypothetical protein
MGIKELAAQFEKAAARHWDELNEMDENFGGPTGYFKTRAKNILEMLSGSMLEANKIPLLEKALLKAYEAGLKRALRQSFNPDLNLHLQEGGEEPYQPIPVKIKDTPTM